MTLANLSYILCFGAYLLWYELDRPKTFEPKTYINIILETAVAINVSFLHLLEVGTAGSGYSILGPENPLDFRGNYIQTSLALSVIGSFAICMANDYVESIAKVSHYNTVIPGVRKCAIIMKFLQTASTAKLLVFFKRVIYG